MRFKNYSTVFLLLLLACFLVATPGFAGDKASAQTKIVGGQTAEEGAWPWIVALQDDWGQFCGGTLVSPEWVVTAAHCTAGMSAEQITIRYGFNVLSSTPAKTVAVDQIVDHPGYNAELTDNDLSLLHLSSAVSGQVVASIISQDDPQALYTTGTDNIVAGWGSLSSGGTYPDDLMQVMVPIFDFAEANKTYSELYGEDALTLNMIAAGYAQGGKDACQGDSGGPLVTSNSGDWKLTGVVSWGEGCAMAEYPGIYTRLSNYREWIEGYIPELAYATYIFNPRKYLEANPGLEGAGITPALALDHYTHYGMSEGRLRSFIPRQYLDANPELELAGITLETALDHYLFYGKSEGRLAQFNAGEYLRANPDLANAGITEETALSHYMNSGRYEHRALFFNPAEYLAANTGLSASGITFDNAVYHYLAYGRNEGRFLAFDGKAYMELYPELANYGYTAENAIDHYLAYGQAEDRAYVGVKAANVEWTDPVTGMKFVWVPAGTFQMGDENGDSSEQPVHTVTVDGFWMGKYEVTQEQWVALMGNNPSSNTGDSNPVENVSWDNAQSYITELTHAGGNTFRLPAEAEWEYACRAGTTTEYYWGDSTDNVGDYAWYADNSDSTTHAVGQKLPNNFGLYDMIGNVGEWVQDWYGIYSSDSQTNPSGPDSGESRVIRGGGYSSSALFLSCAGRSSSPPNMHGIFLGFRLIRQ